MKEGLYKVEFATQRGAGTGVALLSNGRVRGGDAGQYYVGTYTLSGNTLSAELTTDRHTSGPGHVSVFGADRVHIHLSGKIDRSRIVSTGTSPQAPGLAFQAILTHLAD